MITCPFCQFSNEDGSLFCEQCKSDLGLAEAQMASTATAPLLAAVSAVAAPAPVAAVAVPVPEAFAFAPVADVAPPMLEPVAVAAPVTAEPIVAAAPLTAEAVVIPEVAPPPAVLPPVDSLPAATPPADAAPAATAADVQPKLTVIRGLKVGAEYTIYEGHNFIGRMDDKPVDVDLEDQESPERVYCSRQHALLMFENGQLLIEDLNSSNGTFVNRNRIYPGQSKQLQAGDVIQIGTVQMKVKM